MEQLMILGSGPHACEMADLVEQINQQEPRWNLLGFLVAPSRGSLVGQRLIGEHRALGTYDDLNRYPQAQLAWSFDCGFPGFPRERVVNLIAPTAFVASSARLGSGCVLYPGCFVGHESHVGDRLFALSGAIINHDDVIGDDVTMASGATLAGELTVEDGCYLGQSSTVRQQLRIGRGSLIGMGAVVVADVPPDSVMIGNPARYLRARLTPPGAGIGEDCVRGS